MARFILIFLLILAAVRFFWRLIEIVLKASMGPQAASPRGGGPPASVKMQPCPVCGTYVVPGRAISSSSRGTTVYFCSDTCRAEYHPQ